MKQLPTKPLDTLAIIVRFDPDPCCQWVRIAEKYPDPKTAYNNLNVRELCTVLFFYLKLNKSCLCCLEDEEEIRKRFPWRRVVVALRKAGILVPIQRKKVTA